MVAVTRATTEVELRVPAGGSAYGTVVTSGTGAPVRWARVSVEGITTWTASITSPWASVVTDAAGRFELEGLAPGRRSIAAGAYQHHPRYLSGLEVVDGARIGPLRIELDPMIGD